LRDAIVADPEIKKLGIGDALDSAFDLAPSVTAAVAWTGRALESAERIRARLSSPER
jgi:hypothetical protein